MNTREKLSNELKLLYQEVSELCGSDGALSKRVNGLLKALNKDNMGKKEIDNWAIKLGELKETYQEASDELNNVEHNSIFKSPAGEATTDKARIYHALNLDVDCYRFWRNNDNNTISTITYGACESFKKLSQEDKIEKLSQNTKIVVEKCRELMKNMTKKELTAFKK